MLWHVFLRVAVACSCSPLCVCLGNSRWPDGDLVQHNREALLAPTQMAQSQCGWTVSKHAVCTSTESSITERSPHLSLVLLQPVCMPDFKKDKKQALRVLNIKGNIAGSLSSSQSLSCRVNTVTCQPGWIPHSPPIPSPLSQREAKAPSVTWREPTSSSHTVEPHTCYRAASPWCQFHWRTPCTSVLQPWWWSADG